MLLMILTIPIIIQQLINMTIIIHNHDNDIININQHNKHNTHNKHNNNDINNNDENNDCYQCSPLPPPTRARARIAPPGPSPIN